MTGRQKTTKGTERRLYRRLCPFCGVTLEPQRISSIHYDACNTCLGVWLPHQSVKQICNGRQMKSEEFMPQMHENLARTEAEIYTDALTGLRNRRFFDSRLFAEIIRATGSYTLALVLMDLDGFKCANDTFGHATGDFILKQFAELLTALIRGVDMAARVGGDEFALILPETDVRGAVAIANRIVSRTVETEFQTLRKKGRKKMKGMIRVSCGVAVFPYDIRPSCEPGGDDPAHIQRQLFALADAALYKAKDMGRGQTVRACDLSLEDQQAHHHFEGNGQDVMKA